MKKTFISIFSIVLLLATNNVFAQKQPITVELEDPNSFSLIVYPDPQNYSKFDVNQPLFELMTAWTANNIDRLNIKSVLCVGDLVDQNDIFVPEGHSGNQTSREQWSSISKAFERLDNRLPYILCTGNHDYGLKTAEVRHTKFPQYFYPDRNNKFKGVLVSTCENWEGLMSLENAAYELEDPNWGKVLIVVLEFAPRDEPIEWAKKLVDSDKFKDHTVIVMTHSYMNIRAERYEKENYQLTPANFGEAIWKRLVEPSSNIRFVICGHAAEPSGKFETNVSYREDKNASGKTVAQMMFNAQTAGVGWNGNGGDGWLRILEFMPDGKTISVRTFSPFFAISPTTAQHAWRTESYDQFKIVLD